jgi:hypothetical protein
LAQHLNDYKENFTAHVPSPVAVLALISVT